MATTAKDELKHELAELLAYALNTGAESLVRKIRKVAELAGHADVEKTHAEHIERFRRGDEERK